MASMKITKEEPPTSVPTFILHEEAILNPPSYRMLKSETDLLSPPNGDISVASNFSREELVVKAFLEYGDKTNVIANLDLLKQIFASAYSEATVSIAVQLLGDTIILSPTGPEGDQTVEDEALLSNFARLCVDKSCSCPPPAQVESEPPIKQEFLRCNFEGLSLLVVNELLLVNNGNGLTSLHLWDETAVTSSKWMDAWLGNVIANVPAVAVCYHVKGHINGYDFYNTSEIPSAKGISLADGMVLQHGLNVLKFLQSNCKVEHKAYRLSRKIGGDELILEGPKAKNPQTLTLRSGRVYQAFGDKSFENSELDQAERAYRKALATIENLPHSMVIGDFAVRANYGLARVVWTRFVNADKANPKGSFKLVKMSLSYYEVAMQGLQRFPDDDELKIKVYKELAFIYHLYGALLFKEGSTVGELTADAAFEKAFAIYETSTLKLIEACRMDAAGCYLEYSNLQRGICLDYLRAGKSSKASMKAKLVEMYIRKSLEYSGPADYKAFSCRLIEMANHYLMMNEIQANDKNLKSAVSILLEAVKIPEKHADDWKSYEYTETFWATLQKVLTLLTCKNKSGKIKILQEKAMDFSPSLSALKEIEDMWKGCF